MNKRDFLVNGGKALVGGGATALAGLNPLMAMPRPPQQADDAAAQPARLLQRQADWQALCGTDFAARTSVHLPTQLTLTEVRPAGPADTRLEQFTAVFEGPSRRQLPAGLHALAHGTMGDVALYLEPIGSAHGRTTYQAHFSQLV
jgi:hypothetical protein